MQFWGWDFSKIVTLFTGWGYWGAALALFVEGLTIPFPGGTFLLIYGFLASQGKISLALAIASASIGYTIAGTFPYFIGKIGGRPLILNYGPYLGFSHRSFITTEKWFNRFGIPAVALGRLLFFRNYVSYFAGMARMPAVQFYFFTWLGILPWVAFMTVLGYVLGNNWRYALKLFDRYSWLGAVLVISIFLLILFLFKSRLREKIHQWISKAHIK